jgi:hypothetical protein
MDCKLHYERYGQEELVNIDILEALLVMDLIL